jgi:hypothetical protein
VAEPLECAVGQAGVNALTSHALRRRVDRLWSGCDIEFPFSLRPRPIGWRHEVAFVLSMNRVAAIAAVMTTLRCQ